MTVTYTFKLKSNEPNTKQKLKFKLKTKHNTAPKSQYALFIELCTLHSLPYFQFFDEDNWTGPVTKVLQPDFDRVSQIFDDAQTTLKTIMLNGYGFIIIRPLLNESDTSINYSDLHYDQCKLTEDPLIPYNSDMEVDDDDFLDVNSPEYEEFIAEEWKYNGTLYYLDTTTNYLYSPSTLEFIGKKTGDFSIDFDAKER